MMRRLLFSCDVLPCLTWLRESRGRITTMGESKPNVVVIGTGWGGARCARHLDCERCNLVLLSQRNHMVFTPLLPQTCSGSLEFRSICEPILRVQPALAQPPHRFYRSMAFEIDFDKQCVQCTAVGVIGAGADEKVPVGSFDISYDFLVLANGARPNTFNVPGVEEHAFFLREIYQARAIRRRLMQNIMTASLPTTDEKEVLRLMHVVVVGGGPTGVEFAADLAEFIEADVPKLNRLLKPHLKVTLVEAREVLGTFDLHLRHYAAGRLEKLGVEIKKAGVANVTEAGVLLSDGESLPSGLVVWSTGVGPSRLTHQLLVDKTPQGRIAIDDRLRVLRHGKPFSNVFAIGDCAATLENPLPTLAAVASRQGKHLAKQINRLVRAHPKSTGRPNDGNASLAAVFKYRHVGAMASLGSRSALIELQPTPRRRWSLRGLHALILWRLAYVTMLGSARSRLYVVLNWIVSFLFGRDGTYISEVYESKLWKTLALEGASREKRQKTQSTGAEEKKSSSSTAGGKKDNE